MTVSIELGVVSDPQPRHQDRPAGPGLRRMVALVLCALLACGLLGASARPVRETLPMVRVPMGATDIYAMAGERVYVIGPDGAAFMAGPRTITAYAMPGGERVWQRPLGIDRPVAWISTAGDVLMVHLGMVPAEQRVLVLDLATGEPLWEREGGGPSLADADSALFVSEPVDEAEPPVWERVRTATGERLWRREFPAGTATLQLDYGGRDTRVLASGTDGRVEVWDTVAGRLLGAATLPAPADVYVFGDLVVSAGDVMAAYSLPDFRPLWTRPAGPSDIAGVHTQLGGCGPEVICVRADAEDRIVALDPATGQELWGDSTYAWFTPAGPVLLGEQTLLHEGGGTVVGIGPLIAVDPRTGERLKNFGTWQRIRVEEDPATDRTVVAHVDPVEGTVLLAEVDLRKLSLRVIGKVRDVAQECVVAGSTLLCRARDGSLVMWRLPIG